MLLFVEDLDGKGGLWAPNFGELVIFDPTEKQKHILTRDSFYDASPNWMRNGRVILFESKRAENINRTRSLGYPSHLFVLDLTTMEISQFDEDYWRIFLGEIEEDVGIQSPSLSSDNKVAFSMWKGNLAYYQVDVDSIYQIIDDIYALGNIKWSEDNQKIIFTFGDENMSKRSISIVDIETKERKTIGKDKWYFSLGDMQDGYLLYCGYELKDNPDWILFIFDERSGESEEIYRFENHIDYPVFASNEMIYFVGVSGEPGPGYINEDLFSLNLNTNEIKQLTTDGHQKMDLSVFNRN
jgi:dipeptidyl aminopeptidase/acylaminoacyl peptidase